MLPWPKLPPACETERWFSLFSTTRTSSPGQSALVPGADSVWTGAWTLPPAEQGLLVLGAPLGSEAFVQRELSRRREMQDRLLGKLPTVSDLHPAWLLLLFCAAPRANYLLRMPPPEQRKRLPADMMRLCATALPRCCPRARSLCCRSFALAAAIRRAGFAVSC